MPLCYERYLYDQYDDFLRPINERDPDVAYDQWRQEQVDGVRPSFWSNHQDGTHKDD